MGRDLPRGAPPDNGSADPRLVVALADRDRAAVAAVLVETRLIVGVVALPGEDVASEGDMALALLESASGARALPAFSSVETLARWRADARPVPRPATELAAVVQAEGLAALVLDVAGPVPWTVDATEAEALAAGYVPAGEGLAARRSDPVLHPPGWHAEQALERACDGLEVYALDIELPERGGRRAPALGLVAPPGVPPVPLAERLLAAAGLPLDLMLLNGSRLEQARRCGRRLGRG